MIHPHTTCREVSDLVGLGVFASQDIPKGTVIFANDILDIVIDDEFYKKFSTEYQTYIDRFAYTTVKGTRIFEWDHARYVNHCCFSNTLSTGYGFGIAIADIQVNEQITCDYRIFCENDFQMSCHKRECPKTFKQENLPLLIGHWDQKVISALGAFFDVDQPLLEILDHKTIEEISHFIKTENDYKSVALNRPW